MLTLAILAGGKSQRMGRDKSLIPFLGEPLISRVIARLAGLASEVIIIAPKKEEFLSYGYKIYEDIIPGRGSLGGLYTSLASATYGEVAVVGCDMPFVNDSLLSYQQKILISDNYDLVVPSSPRGLEPLHSVYRKSTCFPVVKEAMDLGEQRLISWYPRVNIRTLTQAEILPFDQQGLVFLNINTPVELATAEKLALLNDSGESSGKLT